jgi:5-oxoprolinase (ATP-hydrolysing)
MLALTRYDCRSCHYDGSDTIFQVPISDNVEQDFIDMHFKETSFSMDRNVMVASLMVAGTGKSKGSGLRNPDFAPELQKARLNGEIAYPFKEVSAYFDYETGGRRSDVPVYKLSDAPVRSHILGPAILVDRTQTIVVEPNSTAIVLKRHVVLDVRTNNPLQGEENVSSVDPVALAVFANRFMR